MIFERRSDPREPLVLLVHLNDSEWVVTQDVTPVGMYVRSAGAHQIGETLALEIDFGAAPIKFRANARVVRLRRSGATTELALRLSEQQLVAVESALPEGTVV